MAIKKMKDVIKPNSTRPTGDAEGKAWDRRSEEMYSFLILLTKGTPQGVVKKFGTT